MSLNLQVSIVFCTSVFWTRRQTGHTRQTGAQDSVENSLGRTRRTEANQRTEGEAALGAGEGDHLGRKKMKWGTFSSVKHGMIHGCWWSLIIQSSSFTFFLFLSSVLMLKIKFYAAFPTAIDSDGTSNRYSQGESDTVGWFYTQRNSFGKNIRHSNHFPNETLPWSPVSYLQAAMQRKLGPKGPSMKNKKAGRTLGWAKRSKSRWVKMS